MGNKAPNFSKKLNAFFKKSVPDNVTFLEYIKPFFLNEHENYEKYLEILKKIGIKNGINGLVELITGTANANIKESNKVAQAFSHEIDKKYKNKRIPSTKQDIYNDLQAMRSFEGSMPYAKDMLASGHAYQLNRKLDIDRNVRELPENERKIHDEFGIDIMQLYIYYVLSNIPDENSRTKEFLVEYFKGMNSFYNKEKISNRLITYLEKLKFPVTSIQDDKNKETIKVYTPKNAIPVFNQINDIYILLQKYFDAVQHNSLHKALKTESSNEKLAFKGKQIQLADAFKQLYKSTLITGCNKKELTTWITNVFTYRGQNGKYLPFKENYLSKIISSETKHCKSPILEIRKDSKGKPNIISPDLKGRSQL